MYEDLNNKIINCNYIFVDCFDTLLYRNCSSDGVIDRWLGVVSEKLLISKRQLKDIWSIVTHIKEPDREERSFKQVSFDLFNRILYCREFKEIDLSEKDFEKYLLESYVAVETSVLKVNIDLLKQLRSIKASGKKIFLVSDFYMSKQFFVSIFERFGIHDLFDGIIVSSEVGYRKSTGKLYKWILMKYKLQPSNVLMIGDNKNSDILQAHHCSIQTYRVKSIQKVSSLTANEELENLFDDNLRVDPLSNYAFSLYLFFNRIEAYVEKNNITDIYFCSREGEYFKKEFDKLNKNRKLNVKTHYLLVSRKATFLPSLNPKIEEEQFGTLRNSSPNISIKTFFDTLGLDIDCIGDIQFKKYDEVIQNFFESDEFKSIKKDLKFSKEYYNVVLEAKNEFWRYLYTIGITRQTSNIVLVDIGWRGTIQDHLSSFLGKSVSVTGLYFGLEKTSNLYVRNRKVGLVYSDVPYKSRYFEIFSTNHRMLERIMQASHGSADHYLNGRCILATYEPKEKELYDLTLKTKERISNTISVITEIWNNHIMGFDDKQSEIALLHEAYLSLYSKKLMDEENHMNNLMTMTFGTRNEGISYRTLLKNFYKMPSVEKKNKVLKMIRKSHLNFFADIYVAISRKIYRKRFLRMFD